MVFSYLSNGLYHSKQMFYLIMSLPFMLWGTMGSCFTGLGFCSDWRWGRVCYKTDHSLFALTLLFSFRQWCICKLLFWISLICLLHVFNNLDLFPTGEKLLKEIKDSDNSFAFSKFHFPYIAFHLLFLFAIYNTILIYL